MTNQDSVLEIQALNLLETAVSLSPNEQKAFLTRKTSGNSKLRARVFAIFQEKTVENEICLTGSAIDYLDRTSLPTVIGSYKIEHELGSGGMGTVYLGRKISDDFEFYAAVKVVRKDSDSERLIARLKFERRTLANLRHSNIAHFYDGGETETGNPYFVMEYVKGHKLLEYINRKSISKVQLLSIFQEICSAVAFAHQNLVIHRDLTPSNILVSDDGVVKLIDFGIAHSLNERVERNIADKTGTSGYVAPEKSKGVPASTITDIYSLGIILRQLITYIELPVGDDLRAIANRAADANPQVRYQSVDALNRDLAGYRKGDAVDAAEQTWRYLSKRFFQRHRLLMSSVASTFIILVFSTIAISISHLRTEEAEEHSSKRFEEVRELANFMMFDLYDEVVKLDTSLTAREMLIEKTLTYLDSLSKLPEAPQKLSVELALGYQRMADITGGTGAINLGERTKAQLLYSQAQQQISSALSENAKDPDTIRAYALVFRNIGTFEWINNLNFEKARDNFLRAKQALKGLLESDSATIDDYVMDGALLLSLSQSARNTSDFDNAIGWASEAVDKLNKLHTQHPDHYETQFNLAHAYIYLGEAITSKVDEQGGNIRTALPAFDLGQFHLRKLSTPQDSPTLAKAQYLTALYKRSVAACQLDDERQNAIHDLKVGEALAGKLLNGETQNNFVDERLLLIVETLANCELLNGNFVNAQSIATKLSTRRRAKLIQTPNSLLYISRLTSALSILSKASLKLNEIKMACSYLAEAKNLSEQYTAIMDNKPAFALNSIFEEIRSNVVQCGFK